MGAGTPVIQRFQLSECILHYIRNEKGQELVIQINIGLFFQDFYSYANQEIHDLNSGLCNLLIGEEDNDPKELRIHSIFI